MYSTCTVASWCIFEAKTSLMNDVHQLTKFSKVQH